MKEQDLWDNKVERRKTGEGDLARGKRWGTFAEGAKEGGMCREVREALETPRPIS